MGKLRQRQCEALGSGDRSTVIMFAIVKSKHLLVNVAFKMKRFYSNVGSLKAALQQRPEVLHAVDVNATAHVTLGLVNKLMHEAPVHFAHVGYGIIGIDLGSVLHLVENFGLQSLALHIRHNLSA